ncbi:hypothetical protein EBZ35_01010 [bacterium]|nr:hypothetical protein [bacterium]
MGSPQPILSAASPILPASQPQTATPWQAAFIGIVLVLTCTFWEGSCHPTPLGGLTHHANMASQPMKHMRHGCMVGKGFKG